MKTHITTDKVLDIFNNLKKSAISSFRKWDIAKALKFIKAAGMFMYNFNVTYSDRDLDMLLKDISRKQWGLVSIENLDEKVVVFLDSFGWANRGLTQQYVRGLLKNGYKVIYILHALNLSASKSLLDEFKSYDNIETIVIENNPNTDIQTTGKIIDILKEKKPSKILVHLNVNDVVLLMAIANITGADIYNINLTDHAFWLGAGLIDYNFEFRDYGEKVSLEKRGLKKSQLIRMPFYPIMPASSEFDEFPPLPDDAIIVFTGGSEYKMLGENDMFFKLMDSVLSIAINVYILVAGVPENSVFSSKVANMTHSSRVKLIGVRKDINEVFSHSDIYLSTFPFIGGLMSQFAAYNKLPILAYVGADNSNTVETVISNKVNRNISRYSLENFHSYAEDLIKESAFRKNEGQKNYEAIMKEEDFNKNLAKAMNRIDSEIDWYESSPDYEYMINFYLDNENKGLHSGLFILLKSLRWKSIKLLGKDILPASLLVLQKGKNKLIRKFKS